MHIDELKIVYLLPVVTVEVVTVDVVDVAEKKEKSKRKEKMIHKKKYMMSWMC